MKRLWMTAALLLAIAGPASAATGMAIFTVNGVVEGSITVTIESIGGNSTWGVGTSGVDVDLGSVSKYGVAPTGFTIHRGAADWKLSSAVGVKVLKANLTSASFTLTASLLNAPEGVTWKLNGLTLSDSVETVLTNAGTYDSTTSYSWDLLFTDASTPGYIGNWVSLTATSN